MVSQMEMRIFIMTMIWNFYIPDYTMYEIKDVVSLDKHGFASVKNGCLAYHCRGRGHRLKCLLNKCLLKCRFTGQELDSLESEWHTETWVSRGK